jgi:hypothetical protein
VNGSQSKFLTEFGLYPKINPKPQHTKSAALKPVMLHLPCHGEILRVKKKSNREARTQPKASGENQLKTGGACYEEKNRTSDEPSQITKPAARLSKRSRSPRGTTQPHRIRVFREPDSGSVGVPGAETERKTENVGTATAPRYERD